MKIKFNKNNFNLNYKYYIKESILYLRDLFLWGFDSFFIIFSKFEKPNSVIIVRVDNIGDFILWLPSALKLCSYYSNERKPILVCNKSCADLAVSLDYFSKVIGIDLKKFSRNLWYRWRTLHNISELGPRTIIHPSYSRVFSTGDSIVRVSCANERIGSVGNLSNTSFVRRSISNHWYTRLVPASSSDLMELERNTEFTHELGIVDNQISIPKIPKLLKLSPSKQIYQDSFILFPGASASFKSWPIEAFANVAVKIIEKYRWKPVILGGFHEISLGHQLEEKLIEYSPINLVNKTALTELVEIIRLARILVSNDTSAVHIAASVNTQSVCILGGGHYGRFLPYPDSIEGTKPVSVVNRMECFGCNWHCKFSNDLSLPYPCISSIEVDRVFETIENIIKY